MSLNQKIGAIGEEIARKYLEKKGFKILETNYMGSRWSELDIVAQDENVLVFVEVKTRTSNGYGAPEDAITYFKKKALKRAAFYYCKVHPFCSKSLRMDVVSVILNSGDDSVSKITHYKNAF